jgi:hypothetical protein
MEDSLYENALLEMWTIIVRRQCQLDNVLRMMVVKLKKKTKLPGLSPRADYTDRATAACRRS